MSSATKSAVVLGLIAVLIVCMFIVLWIRDRKRSDHEAQDPDRMRQHSGVPSDDSGAVSGSAASTASGPGAAVSGTSQPDGVVTGTGPDNPS